MIFKVKGQGHWVKFVGEGICHALRCPCLNYMQEAKWRRVRHESEPSFIRKTYSIGDTVCIRIHKIDRTNADSNILACKVLEVKKVTDSKSI